MSILFLMSMFFLSFAPLWICIICIDAKSLIEGTDNPYTEWISLALIAVVLIASVSSAAKTLKMQLSPDEDRYMVVAAEKDTVSTTTYLLSNVLPLLAFDFTLWFDAVQFLIILLFLAILCLLHYRCDSNVCLELAGYRLYNCSLRGKGKPDAKCRLHNDFGDKEETAILIRRKQLNVNDEIIIRRLNDNLYIAKYIAPEEQIQ